MTRILALLALLTYATLLSAQNIKPDAGAALQLFKDNDFETALLHYEPLYHQFSKDPRYNFYYGACLVETNQQISLASRCLKFAALRNFNKEVHFYLARAYQLNYEFEEAANTYTKFLKLPLIPSPLKERANIYIQECQTGSALTPKIYEFKVAAADTTSQGNELAFYALSPDMGKVMRNSSFFETGIEPNGIMFVTERGDRVFYATQNAENNRHDIYRMDKLIDGWGSPIKLGTQVNSPYDEKYPLLLTDGTTLYFSSNRPGGLGGYDIYKATYNADTNDFGDVTNLGIPFNSPRDDYFFVPDDFSQRAWFASNRSTKNNKSVVYKIIWDNSVVRNSVPDINKVKEAAQLTPNSEFKSELAKTNGNNRTNGINTSSLFTFIITDTLEYTQLEHFRSQEALREFKQGRFYESKKDSLTTLMKEKRMRYAVTNSETERNNMVNDILRLEKETYSIDASIQKHYNNAVKFEQEKIKLLVQSGNYTAKEGTKVEPKNNVPLNLSDIPKDLTLFTPDEFGRQLQALQNIYNQLFDDAKKAQLQQADSLFVWGNLLNIESSRLLERASKTTPTTELTLPLPLKKEEPAQPTGEQLFQQSRQLKQKALTLYHQSLDVKYAIYKTKIGDLSGNNSLTPLQQAAREAVAFYNESAQLYDEANLLGNIETFEKAGTMKRKAVEAQEKGLFTYIEKGADELHVKTVDKSQIQGYVAPSYSEIHKTEAVVVTPPKKEPETVPANTKPIIPTVETQKNDVLVYKIQIGVFRNQPNEQVLKKLSKITSEKLPNSELTKYYAGVYYKYDDANNDMQNVKDAGFSGAFIVAFVNGTQITIQQARDIEQKK